MGGSEVALGSLITAASGMIGVILAKCRCVYRRDDEGTCMPACGFTDKSLLPEKHELEIVHETIDDVDILILTKKEA